MATDGLSLVGFVDDPAFALHHLRVTCVPAPPNKSDVDLQNDWQAAKVALGASMPSAGVPRMHPIQHTEPHIQALLQSHWGGEVNALIAGGATFQMMEIDPLLAYQLTIDKERSLHHCRFLSASPTFAELLNLAFPLGAPTDEWHIARQGHPAQHFSMLVRGRGLNLRIAGWGTLQPQENLAGIALSWGLPLVQVVEFGGRCYLHNGFHRTYGARVGGADYIPCLYRKVSTAGEAGIAPPGTFDEPLLQSANPPTVGHFTGGRALDVRLRQASKVIQISWAQQVIYEE